MMVCEKVVKRFYAHAQVIWAPARWTDGLDSVKSLKQ